MFRAPDPWDVALPVKKTYYCGFPRDLDTKYDVAGGRQLGQGGFGSVKTLKLKATGTEYACKSIKKSLDVPNLPEIKQTIHLENIKREVAILRKLRGTLNVVFLEDVYEDDTHVHIVMELCKGGELLQRIGKHHYSERTVASYMRAVLRTLAQCHHHRILHRDIKPGNFMLLMDTDDAPVKAIDFGLAVFFDPKALPVKDLGLEGTPHYMAPEMLSSEVLPASDVWAAGVMAFQLLSGRFPFDDWKNLKNPALSQLWKSILTEEPKFSGAAWAEVSEGAKDFIKLLLTKDPKARPSAKAALEHPWIQGRAKQRAEGKPLAHTIVQRLQRYAAENAFKRTVLDMITNELLQRHMTSALLGARAAAAPLAVSPKTSAAATQADLRPLAGSPTADAIGSKLDPNLRVMAARSLISSVAAKCPTVHGASTSSVYALLQAQKAAMQRSGSITRNSFEAWNSGVQPVVMAPQGSDAASAGVQGAGSPLPPSNTAPMAIPGAMGRRVSEGPSGFAVGSQPVGSLPTGYMPSRKSIEGSGHRLQHYAFLLAAGERSVNGIRTGSVHGPGVGSVFAQPQSRPSLEMASVTSPAKPMPVGGSLHRNDDMLRLLGSVSRQRMEHRKMQRLILDTSGRAQSSYLRAAGQSEHQPLEPVIEVKGGATAAAAAAAAAEQSRRSSESGSVDSNVVESSGPSKEAGLLQTVGRALLKPLDKVMAVDGGGVSGTSGANSTAAPASGSETPDFSRGSARVFPPEREDHENLEDNQAARRNLEEGGRGRGAAYAALFGAGGADSGGAAASAVAGDELEGGGRRGKGKGAFAALMAAGGTDVGAAVAPSTGGGGNSEGASGGDAGAGAAVRAVPLDNDVLQPAAELFAIRTVKAHKQPVQAPEPAQPDPATENIIAAQLARLEDPSAMGALSGASGNGPSQATHTEGTVSKGMLYSVLASLMGGPAQVAEFESVMQKLQYDKNQELSFAQISEGLQYLGYWLEPSEVEVLLREVAMGADNQISQSTFLASQVDWREFQANHREEWLACLRSAFQGLDSNADGRIGTDEIVALLKDKLPEEEVNLAVQETLMDAALGSEGLDFDDFVRLLRADSVSDLASQGSDPIPGDGAYGLMRKSSMDLYDTRFHADSSLHGSSYGGAPTAALGQVAGSPNAVTPLPGAAVAAVPAGAVNNLGMHWVHHYTPQLPTVPDSDDEA